MQVTMNERRAVKEAKSKVGILQALLEWPKVAGFRRYSRL
jgi:hypothetical protein